MVGEHNAPAVVRNTAGGTPRHTQTHTRRRGSDFLAAEIRQTNKVHTQVYTSASQSQHAVIHGSPSLIAQSTQTHTHSPSPTPPPQTAPLCPGAPQMHAERVLCTAPWRCGHVDGALGAPPAPPPRVQRLRCPTNTSVRTVFFGDLINLVRGLGTELIGYRTACPTNTPVRTVFFEGLIVRWTGGGGMSVVGIFPMHRRRVPPRYRKQAPHKDLRMAGCPNCALSGIRCLHYSDGKPGLGKKSSTVFLGMEAPANVQLGGCNTGVGASSIRVPPPPGAISSQHEHCNRKG